MRILFDQGTPRALRRYLGPHEIKTAVQMEWSELDNGDLLQAAETAFDVLITTDKNIRYQQNLLGRRLAIVVLPQPTWHVVRIHADNILQAVNSIKPGEYLELRW